MAPTVCNICKGVSFQYIFPGVKNIATEVKKYFSNAIICVIEKDKILGDVQKSNHVVSTPAIRTIASELFDNIVISQGDAFISRAFDYRSEEKELENLAVLRSLLKPNGKFIIQTFQPDHKFFSSAENPDSASKEILKEREEYFYPPAGILIRLIPRKTLVKSVLPLPEKVQKEILQYGGIINTTPVYTVRMPLKHKSWALEMLKNYLAKEWEAIINPPLLSQKV
jgi:primosomal protein N'